MRRQSITRDLREKGGGLWIYGVTEAWMLFEWTLMGGDYASSRRVDKGVHNVLRLGHIEDTRVYSLRKDVVVDL